MRTILLKSNCAMPILGMGTWCFGGRTERDPANDDAAQIALLRTGIERGFTLIDTAEYYAAGFAETLVGKAIADFDREKLFLTSKVWKTHVKKADVIRSAEESLRRLNTDYLDLYLYHQYNPEVPLQETLEAMNELIDRQLVRSIGVSNFGASLLRKAISCSAHPVTVNQVHYNLGVRDAEPELLACCKENAVVLQAWRPVRDLKPDSICLEMMKKYGITFNQLALAWLLNQPNVTTLTATRNPEHLQENYDALQIALEPADLALLSKTFPRSPGGAGVKLA